MQAIILAAGMGRRLKKYTANNTKCMVRVNGETLISRMLRQLDSRQLSQIVIVTGYEGKKLVSHIEELGINTKIVYIENDIYDRTNNIYSLSLAKDHLISDDTLLFESDIIFEDAVLDELISDPRETLALVDKYESWMDGTCLKLDDDDRITDFISGKDFDFRDTNGCYKTVNIYKLSKAFSSSHYVPFMEAYLKAIGQNEYYEQVLKVIAMLDDAEIRAKKLVGQKWYEIDDEQDLDIAEVLFDPDEDNMISRIEKRYGGYWRFPKVMDCCYLENPYYPPQKMIDEIKASFETLLIQYPSGMEVNSLLAAKNFGVSRDSIVVGNGAAELIKYLMEKLHGTIGFIRPSFEEYYNRCSCETVVFTPDDKNFVYTADDIIDFFEPRDISNLILINPDNPSGNYIDTSGIKKLAEWSRKKDIRIILDESFTDFSDELNNSFIKQDFLDENPNFIIVKSISKLYGVPGLRLGVIASGDRKLIAGIKDDTPIWNINSFAEFYLQIQEKYKRDYIKGLEIFRTERSRFLCELRKIDGMRILPTQANYIMAELVNGMSAHDFTKRLFLEHRILIKDLSKKIRSGEYVRIAVRTKEDNDRLISGIRSVLSEDE